MVCIYCKNDTSVVNSRRQKQANHIWRRRLCRVCENVFTTIERPELASSVMVRSQGTLRPFLRDQLFVDLYACCRHRKTPLSDASALTDLIISALLKTAHHGALERDKIIEITEEVLHRFDRVAATIYSAYHPTGRPLPTS